jgi:hypothetical protein
MCGRTVARTGPKGRSVIRQSARADGGKSRRVVSAARRGALRIAHFPKYRRPIATGGRHDAMLAVLSWQRWAGAVILEAASITDARMLAIEAGVEVGLTFIEGHMLGADRSTMVTAGEIGRLLPLNEARRIIERFEAAAEVNA